MSQQPSLRLGAAIPGPALLLLFLFLAGPAAGQATGDRLSPLKAPEPASSGTAYRDAVADDYYQLRPLSPDPALLSPKAFFGFALGERHLSHDEILAYFRYLDRSSDRLRLLPYGRSWEQRPLLVALISQADQLSDAALARTQAAQAALTRPDATAGELPEAQGTPLVLYQGCSVHGNEASGANAAVQYAYQLLSSRDAEVEALLSRNLILLDPALNPDGIQRFAGWVNMHRGLDPDPLDASREHNESWPGGRTNHYWFDLNRDWLPLTQPESTGRVALFYDWMPQVLTDHHEMGRNNSFFFQPGIPSRTNPITPARNQELTAKLGVFHARALDALGSTYYSRESFDDYYYGKGSTFPDVNGSVGILFEQASARGHLQESSNGELSFAFAVRNQLATLWSTLEGADALSGELRAHTKSFFEEGLAAGTAAGGGHLVASSGDPARDAGFLERLIQHRLEVLPLSADVQHEGQDFRADHAWFVPMAQPRSRMVKALFARTRSFPDSLFYDVSAWTLPLAWGLSSIPWSGKAPAHASPLDQAPEISSLMGMPSPGNHAAPILSGERQAPAYAYLLHWPDQATPALAADLLEEGFVLKMATKSFRIPTSGRLGIAGQADPQNKASEALNFPPGTLVLRSARQPESPEALAQRMAQAAQQGVRIWTVAGGQSQKSIDLGSPSLKALTPPRIAILVGSGVNAYDAGSLWQELDRYGGYRPSLLSLEEASSRKRLDRFNTIVMPHGYYARADDAFWDALESWVREGGHLMAIRNASRDLASRGWAGLKEASSAPKAASAPKPYDEANRRNGARYLGGAIFRADGDWTHPLLYGFGALRARSGNTPKTEALAYNNSGEQQQAAVFLQSSAPFAVDDQAYAAPLRLSLEDPVLAGYAHPSSLEQWSDAPLLYVGRMGAGRVTAFAFSPTFRAFWRNTARLVHNALYCTPLLDRSTMGAAAQEAQDAHETVEDAAEAEHGHRH